MLSRLYKTVDSLEVKGEDMVIPAPCQGVIYLSQTGEVFCFMGVFCRNSGKAHFGGWPYYLEGKHTFQCQNQVRGFFRIKWGCILLTQFLDQDYHNEMYYKELNNHVVRLPVPNSCTFSIEERIETEGSVTLEEDEDLTRACFGLTYQELECVVKVYAELLGVSNAYVQYPRITRSIRSDNFCDITGIWIPAGFPYVAFSDSAYAYSHVSLYGFYRHMGALLSMGSHTNGTRLFEQQVALAKNAISGIKSIDDDFPSATKVTRDIIYSDKFV